MHGLSSPVACGSSQTRVRTSIPYHSVVEFLTTGQEGIEGSHSVPSGVPTSGILCLMVWGRTGVIITELKCTINVTHLTHSETIPFQSVEKLSSWHWSLVPEMLKTAVVEIPGSGFQISLFLRCYVLFTIIESLMERELLLTLFMFSKWGPALRKAISSYWTVTSPRVSRRERLTPKAQHFERAPGHHQWCQVPCSLSFSLPFPWNPLLPSSLSSSAL